MPEKPKCPLIGQNGNIFFNLMGIASKTLKRNGMSNDAKEMCDRITSSASYDEALSIIDEYVEITSADDEETEDFGMEMMWNDVFIHRNADRRDYRVYGRRSCHSF